MLVTIKYRNKYVKKTVNVFILFMWWQTRWCPTFPLQVYLVDPFSTEVNNGINAFLMAYTAIL